MYLNTTAHSNILQRLILLEYEEKNELHSAQVVGGIFQTLPTTNCMAMR